MILRSFWIIQTTHLDGDKGSSTKAFFALWHRSTLISSRYFYCFLDKTYLAWTVLKTQANYKSWEKITYFKLNYCSKN